MAKKRRWEVAAYIPPLSGDGNWQLADENGTTIATIDPDLELEWEDAEKLAHEINVAVDCHESLVKACQVIAFTPEIANWLLKNDPKALKQVNKALVKAERTRA